MKILPAVVTAATMTLYGCLAQRTEDTLDRIRQSGTIRVLVENQAEDYYRQRNAYAGLESRLVKRFADYLGVTAQIIHPGETDARLALVQGQVDLITSGLATAGKWEDAVLFSNEFICIKPQIVFNGEKAAPASIEALDGVKIHVRENTPQHKYLKAMKDNGAGFQIISHAHLSTEELLRRVARGRIEAAAANNHTVRVSQTYFPQPLTGVELEEETLLRWAVGKNETRLLAELNRFIRTAREKPEIIRLYSRYYSDMETFDAADVKTFISRMETLYPKYEAQIRDAAFKYGFDWQVIAALVYQESNFDPFAQSKTGVKGLLQLTTPTAREMGVEDRLDPEQSIDGGVRYLQGLYQRFEDIPNPDDRLFYALAAYNLGYKHVRNAQELMRSRDWDPTTWRSLKKTLPLLQKAAGTTLQYGGPRGLETVQFIERILVYTDIIRYGTRAS